MRVGKQRPQRSRVQSASELHCGGRHSNTPNMFGRQVSNDPQSVAAVQGVKQRLTGPLGPPPNGVGTVIRTQRRPVEHSLPSHPQSSVSPAVPVQAVASAGRA
jgi:hypothetical protein